MLIKKAPSLLLPFLLILASMHSVAQELTKSTTDYETLNKSTTDTYVMTEEKTTNDFDVDGLAGVNPQIESVWLVDADADVVIGEISDGQVFDRALLPPNLTIMVEANAATGSVQFGYGDTLVVQTENGVPYAIGGDSGGDYHSYPLPDGWHTVRARPFAADDAGGSYGDEVLISFAIFEDGVAVDPSLDLDVAAPGRYQIYDDTVYDNQTGLEWQRGNSTLAWEIDDEYAEQYCLNLDLGGKQDWRVPEFLELHSIVKYERKKPGTPTRWWDLNAFPDTINGHYISSTRQRLYPDRPAQSILVNFRNGKVHDRESKEWGNIYVRCVRGGNGLTPSFQINDNDTVTDRTRSIIWERYIDESNWDAEHCANLQKAGLSNWRVPTVHEMASLLDFRQQQFVTYTTVFPQTGAYDLLWMTSQINNFDSNEIWVVHFEAWWGEYIMPHKETDPFNIVRCVHSAD